MCCVLWSSGLRLFGRYFLGYFLRFYLDVFVFGFVFIIKIRGSIIGELDFVKGRDLRSFGNVFSGFMIRTGYVISR